LTDDFSERDNAIGYQFRVLDEICGVADNTRNQDLPAGSFTSRQLRPTGYEGDLSPIAANPGNVHDLALIQQ
jgi:hypothetical protein